MRDFSIEFGFEGKDRSVVAALYWEAFRAKLGKVLGPDGRAEAFLAAIMDPDHAVVARNADTGQVVGLAGFRDKEGSLTAGSLSDLAKHYGWIGGAIRGIALSVLERDLTDGILLMDGICVSSDARGLGVGTALLGAIKNRAIENGYQFVRLDVIDSNPRARKLYEQQGFLASKKEYLGPLKYLFGFSSSTEMLWDARQRRDAAN